MFFLPLEGAAERRTDAIGRFFFSAMQINQAVSLHFSFYAFSLNNICTSSPRAALLQRAEAGEGLAPDDAVGASGGVSAGRHDLRDPRRHA